MQIKRNPWLRTLYLTLLLPVASGVVSFFLLRQAIISHHAFSDRFVQFILGLCAAGLSVKCWEVTWVFARDMRRFLETLQAIKRGEYVLPSARAGLPEIEELAREMGSLNESPDTSLTKWIVLSRDHQAIFMRLVEAMSASMSTKSFYARGHSGRVAEYSSLICSELGLPAQESTRIRLSALLHDIGKIGMDSSILTKPDRLTNEEFAILQTHPARGVEMLRPVPDFADLLPGIELHHESLDGSGYPHGLKGKEIPQMARIIAVADAFDAMTHHRTYQDAMDGAYALRLIRSMSGKKFDEHAVEAFCRAYAAGLVLLPKPDNSEEEAWNAENAVAPPETSRPSLDAVTSNIAGAPPLVGASSR